MPDEKWIILDPHAHRIHQNRQPKPDTMEFMGQTVPVVNVAAPEEGPWQCDFCNDDIETMGEFILQGDVAPVPIPMKMLDNNALCDDCAKRCGDFDAETQPWHEWSHKGCGCPACRLGLDIIIAAESIQRLTNG